MIIHEIKYTGRVAENETYLIRTSNQHFSKTILYFLKRFFLRSQQMNTEYNYSMNELPAAFTASRRFLKDMQVLKMASLFKSWSPWTTVSRTDLRWVRNYLWVYSPKTPQTKQSIGICSGELGALKMGGQEIHLAWKVEITHDRVFLDTWAGPESCQNTYGRPPATWFNYGTKTSCRSLIHTSEFTLSALSKNQGSIMSPWMLLTPRTLMLRGNLMLRETTSTSSGMLVRSLCL